MGELRFSKYPSDIEINHRRRVTKRFGEFVTTLSGYVCDSSPERETAVLSDPQCRQLIRNDGRSTFAVHSTSIEAARLVMQSGLASPGIRNIGKGLDIAVNPSRPHFGRTVVLLAGPKERDQTRINTHALAYTYGENEENVA